MILVGDLGGTNARLALTEPGSSEPVAETRATTTEFADFASVLATYLAQQPASVASAISSACLAIAGPIADDGRSARFTNLPWTIDAAALEQRFGIQRVRLVNDFAAAAMGVTVTPAEHLVPLQAGEPLANAPKLVIGAGTGLGMAILVCVEQHWRVIPGEGGHIAFAPLDDDQERVWHALRKEHGRVTAERVISGPGLAAIYQTLADAVLTPEDIAGRAQAGDALAARSINVFLAAYGAYAGDMAMTVLARGGVYLAGGIAAKLLPMIDNSPFLSRFNAKAEHAALVKRIPVAVATDPALGFRGAACLADIKT